MSCWSRFSRPLPISCAIDDTPSIGPVPEPIRPEQFSILVVIMPMFSDQTHSHVLSTHALINSGLSMIF